MKKVSLTKGMYALVDDEDYEFVNQYNWCVQKCHLTYYAMRSEKKNGKHKNIMMHRLIMGRGKYYTDHINGNGLDNRKCNLRKATSHQNNYNQRKRIRPTSSKYKGVFFDKRDKKWKAHIGFMGSRFRLGAFNTEKDAAKAYDVSALKLFGEFARPNFNPPTEPK